MSTQSDWTLPQLGNVLFLEKPPLSYWMGAAAIKAFGDTPPAARLPNLLYAAVTALAVGALALLMEGSGAAVIGAVAASSAIIAYRVTIWLAPDAGLLAGCALGLLGAYAGFSAPAGRRKLLGYTLMHLGAALGFMAKSAPGWLVPALALLAVIAWERRWSELLRWELYVGFLAQAVLIGPWIYEVAHATRGADALASLFWHNLFGRFMKIPAPAGLDYTTGHKNRPGKYLVELPVYLLPWTLLAVAALRRAWRQIRLAGPTGASWRFAVSAVAPFLVLLSVAQTARDIYAAPAILGFGVLIALWAAEIARDSATQPVLFSDRLALYATEALIAVIVAAFVAVLVVLAVAEPERRFMHVGTAAVIAGTAVVTLRHATHAVRRANILGSFGWIYTAFAATFTLGALAVFPTIDRWQDLPALARQITADARGVPFAVLGPDETTTAILDHGPQMDFTRLATDTDTAEHVVSSWFLAQGPRSRVLVKLPGSGPGAVSRLLDRIHPIPNAGDGIAGALLSEGVAVIVRRYELPQGRRYALLGPGPSSVPP
jgi:4-amino-4-deoxy-L-arabinose transferase-like glycosyltransferase